MAQTSLEVPLLVGEISLRLTEFVAHNARVVVEKLGWFAR
jgi:hypothetical protein